MLRSLFVLAPLLLTAAIADDPDELFRRGIELFSHQDSEGAIAAFRRAADLRPGDAAIWKALGVVYAARGDYQSAEKPFETACRLKPDLLDACLYYGRALYLQNRFETALEVLRAAPRGAQSLRIQALCLEALGRSTDAANAFTETLRIYRDSAPNEDPAIDFGVFLYRQGRAVEALTPLRTATARHPQSSRAALELGAVLLSLDQLQEASIHLETAARLDPDSSRAHLLLGKAYQRLGKTAEAEKELRLVK